MTPYLLLILFSLLCTYTLVYLIHGFGSSGIVEYWAVFRGEDATSREEKIMSMRI